jgi:hypothetical protein
MQRPQPSFCTKACVQRPSLNAGILRRSMPDKCCSEVGRQKSRVHRSRSVQQVKRLWRFHFLQRLGERSQLHCPMRRRQSQSLVARAHRHWHSVASNMKACGPLVRASARAGSLLHSTRPLYRLHTIAALAASRSAEFFTEAASGSHTLCPLPVVRRITRIL